MHISIELKKWKQDSYNLAQDIHPIAHTESNIYTSSQINIPSIAGLVYGEGLAVAAIELSRLEFLSSDDMRRR